MFDVIKEFAAKAVTALLIKASEHPGWSAGFLAGWALLTALALVF